MKIALDPGHGTKGTGASGIIDEAVYNWKVCKILEQVLIAAGYEVFITRGEKERPTAKVRTTRAKNAGCSIFLAIHFNAGGGDGAEAYVQYFGDKAIAAASSTLANSILAQMAASGQQSRGVKYKATGDNSREYFEILYYARINKMPAILLELAFVDTKDALDFDTDPELKKWAGVITSGVKQAYPLTVKTFSVIVSSKGTLADARALNEKLKALGLSTTLMF